MTLLLDRYELGEPLGAGGTGRILRAFDRVRGTHVAVKLLKKALLDDVSARARFAREAESLRRLDHPSIVRVLDVGEAEGDVFTVLSLVAGETLEHLLAREGALPLPRALAIADALLDALAACHAHDVVHRDVKPSNVMIGETVTLIDFGLARLSGGELRKLTETGTVQGTPHYMAPEQCRGEEVGPEADVYATGVVLYEMCSGRTPFDAKDAATFMAQHLFVDAPPLADVPERVAKAVRAALAKPPEARPTASALRAMLADERPERDAATRASDASAPRLARSLAATKPAIHSEREARAARILIATRAARPALAASLGAAGHACVTDAGDLTNVDVALVEVDRVAELRARDAALPIVALDVAGADGATAAIRAGASDMLLAGAPEADLIPKIARLLRRRR